MDELNLNEEQQGEFAHDQGYRIVIAGELDPSWSEWLGGMQIASSHDRDGKRVSTLSGEVPDQAALRGILNKIWDLHFILLSVTRIYERDRDNPEEVNDE
jgi:hypothetical protein